LTREAIVSARDPYRILQPDSGEPGTPIAARYRPDAESTLSVITGFGLAFAFFLAVTALNEFDWGTNGQGWGFIVLSTLTFLFVVAHVPLKWWPPAVRLSQLAWLALVLFSVAWLWRMPHVLPVIVVFPLAIGIKLWFVGERLAAYLNRTLDDAAVPNPPDPLAGDECRVCGERGSEIVAPAWCFSFIWLAARQIGRPRRLCPHHARLYALPAVFVSGILGWWSIWGLFWTPAALLQNLVDGGRVLDEEPAREWLEKANEGPLGISGKEMGIVLFLFVLAFATAGFGRAR
jgi:hypothetical protein